MPFEITIQTTDFFAEVVNIFFYGVRKERNYLPYFFDNAHFKSDAVSIIKYCYAVCYLYVMYLEFLCKLKQHYNLKWPYYNIPLHTGGKK